MASDPYLVYNRPVARYDEDSEPVYNPYSGQDDYHNNRYPGDRNDVFVPPTVTPPISEKPAPDVSRTPPARILPECVVRSRSYCRLCK